MKFWQILALFFLCLISFSPYFFRPDFVEGDSYYFLNHLCGKLDVYNPPATTIVANIFFELLPCNFVFLKSLLFIAFFLGVLTISFIGKLFNEKHGWLAGVFAFLSPILSAESLKFENDQFAYFFLFAAIYFFYKAKIEKKNLFQAISLGLILIGTSFWNGGAYLILAFGLNSVFFFLISLALLFFFFNTLIRFPLFQSLEIIAKTIAGEKFRVILEQKPFIALKDWFLLVLGVGATSRQIAPQLFFFVFLGLTQVKFAVLAIPFLSAGVMLFYAKIVNSKKHWVASLAKFLVILSVFFSFAWGALVFSYFPHTSTWEAIEYGLIQAKDLNAKFIAQWDLGYWVHWHGKETEFYGTMPIPPPDYNSMKNTVILTEEDVACEKLKNFQTFNAYYCP